MDFKNFFYNFKVDICLAYASGTATRNGAILDMTGYEGVVAIAVNATLASSAVGDIHWEQGAESDLSDAADLEGTAIAIADDDDDQIFGSELIRPTDRYVRAVITKDASHAQAETVIYIRYGSRKDPQDNNVDDTITTEIHITPDEGTK